MTMTVGTKAIEIAIMTIISRTGARDVRPQVSEGLVGGLAGSSIVVVARRDETR